MMRLLLLISLMFGFNLLSAFGQGTLRGKITDDSGEPVVGASVVLKNNMTIGTQTDFDGNFSLVIKDSLPVVIRISYISFKTIEYTANPLKGQVLVKNFTLVGEGQEIEIVEIEAKASREKDAYMEKVKAKSATTIDYISAETIKKTGDSYVLGAIARVSGVSTTSEGIVTVRGIGDRYVKTTLNNAIIPTLDPLTNNLKLDIFPTSLIDNVVVSKTSRPDYPGDWAGAYISVLTKDYPESLNINFETSVGYNSQSTFNEFLTSKTSSTDWLGYDSDLRDRDHSNFNNVTPDPNQYTELVALGLGPYYESIGVTTPWLAGTATGEAYFKLGLVQLGLLSPALFNDPVAIATAKNAYNSGPYINDAYLAVNKKGVETSKSFANNWDTQYKSAPLDFSQSFSIGNQVMLFKRPLGFLTGFRYASIYRYDPNAVSDRSTVDINGVGGIASSSDQQRSNETHNWSVLFNLNYKLNNNNSIGFLFMPNMSGTNKVRNGVETGSTTYALTINRDQFYESRKQFIYQFKSEHYLPKLKSKIELNGSYTDGESTTPDFKRFEFYSNGGDYIIDATDAVTSREYQYLNEDILDTRGTFEFPLKEEPGLSRKIKFGGSYSKNDRTSDQYSYTVVYNGFGTDIIENNDINAYFSPESFDFIYDPTTGLYTIDKYYVQSDNPADHIIGYNEVIAGFVMADYNFSYAFRLTGGVRVEKANIFTDVYEYDQLGYGYNDPRRQFAEDIFIVNPGTLDEVSVLPSVGLIYNITRDQENPFNLRANYSQSVARPSIRELSDAIVYDYEFQDNLFGNSDLKMVTIDNYDIRLERFFKSNDNVSVSLFYKDFMNHIEFVASAQGYTWQNVDDSYVAGIEVEGRKKLFKNFEFIGNVTFVKSETNYISKNLVIIDGVKTYVPEDTITRVMYGQAPYVINGILNYTNDTLGFSISASYNLQGEKLAITSTDGNPDIFEAPRHILDMKISKKLGKWFTVGFKMQNLLNSPIVWRYDFSDKDVYWDKYKTGSTYTVSLSYRFIK